MIIAALIVGFALSFGLAAAGLYLWLPSGTEPTLSAPVSYTHLTLPTSDLVSISVVAVS